MQRLVERGDDRSFDGLFAHTDRRAGKVALLHRTISDNNHFVKQFLVFFESDRNRRLVTNLNFFRHIANVRYDQHVARLCVKQELSVKISGNTRRCPFDLDTRTNDWPHGIGDDT